MMISPYNRLNPFGRKVSSGLPFTSTNYQAIYNAMTTPPSAPIAAQQDILVKALEDATVWSKLDLFYLFAQEVNSDREALINWINPGTKDALLVNTPAFVSLEGFTGNGTNAYINTAFNPSIDATKYTLNSASIGAYTRLSKSEDTAIMGNFSGGIYVDLFPRLAAGNYIVRINGQSSTLSNPIADSKGMLIGSRPDSVNINVFKNKVKATSAIASNSLMNATISILARGTTFVSTNQVSMSFIGSDMTQQNVNDLTDAFEVYMDSNGKGVIP